MTGKGRKTPKQNLDAGPEAPLSGACLDQVTASFERNKVPRSHAAAFATMVVEGHVETKMLKELRSDAISVLGDSKVAPACKKQMRNALD